MCRIGKHFDKQESAQADERHFFVMLYTRVLPFQIFSVLMFDDPQPQEPPDLPDHISHLWLAPYSRRVLLRSKTDEWQNIYPYTDRPYRRHHNPAARTARNGTGPIPVATPARGVAPQPASRSAVLKNDLGVPHRPAQLGRTTAVLDLGVQVKHVQPVVGRIF